jgi:hypothetical protein
MRLENIEKTGLTWKNLQDVSSPAELKTQQVPLESELKQGPPSDDLCAKLEHLAQ